jgi:hypothetical protein
MVEWRKLACKYWILLTLHDEDVADCNPELLREVIWIMRDTNGFNDMHSLWTVAHTVVTKK